MHIKPLRPATTFMPLILHCIHTTLPKEESGLYPPNKLIPIDGEI
jgi:hypothetical protein